ncbi:unnamed protein product [Choristocarpus tenellus]
MTPRSPTLCCRFSATNLVTYLGLAWIGIMGLVEPSLALHPPSGMIQRVSPSVMEFCGSKDIEWSHERRSRRRGEHTMGFGGKKSAKTIPELTDTPPIKVALMIEPTPFTHISGYSNRFREMLKFMSKAGDDIQILTTDDKSDAPTCHLQFPITTTGGFRFPLYNHIVLSFDHERKGWDLLKRMKPDIIHVTSPGFFVLTSLLYARLMRVPLVLSYHTHLPLYARSYMGWIPFIEDAAWSILRMAHNRADLTLCTSPQMKAELETQGIERVDVWRKGIDVERFNPEFKSADMRSKLSDGRPNDPLIIYIGRLGSEKRLRDLRGILERIPKARLALVGTGPDEDALKEYFAGTKTVFTGSMSGVELSQAFASADVFVMPSDSETLGFVVLESMASGVPVVGADAGGIPDLISHGKNGFLVPPGDLDGFASRVTDLLENKVLRQQMSLDAREETEKWSWESATSYLRNVQYKQAMKNFRWRAFGGLGLPRTKTRLRALSRKAKLVKGAIKKVFRWPGQSPKPEVTGTPVVELL